MAEVPLDGLYGPPDSVSIGVSVDDGHFEVVGVAFGPAGVSSLQLPDGVWTVDHADPGQLVRLDIESDDPASTPLLLVAFGGDGALRVVDDPGFERGPDEPPPDTTMLWSAPRGGGPDAVQAGRLVVLADLAADPLLDPMARVVAAVELAASFERAPGGELFVPLLPDLLAEANRLASDVEDPELPDLDRKNAFRLLSPIEQAVRIAHDLGVPSNDLRRLGDRLQHASVRRPASRERFADADLMAMSDALHFEVAEDAYRDGAIEREVAPAPEDFMDVRRVSPSELHVTAARSDDERWVRVLRRDGLVLLALAPLHSDGLMETAEVLLPPDTLDDEIDVQVVHADELEATADAPAELLRDAVRAGRAAVSSERLGSWRRAQERWSESADLWERLGDRRRAELARFRSPSGANRFGPVRLLADELDPFQGVAD